MHKDIVFPENNEESLMIFAKKLGFSEIIFTYAYSDPNKLSEQCKIVSEKLGILNASSKINYRFAAALSKSTLNNAQSLKEKGFLTFVDISGDFSNRFFERDELDKYLRIVASSRYIDGIFGLEKVSTKKGLHYRNSGMNHIHAKMFFDNHIALLENQKDINLENNKKSNLQGIIQNIVLSEKYHFPVGFFSFAKRPEEMSSCEDLNSVLKIFGSSKIVSNADFF